MMQYKIRKKLPLTSTECQVGPEINFELNAEECNFSKKQIEFLEKCLNIKAPIFQDKIEVINMAEEGKSKEQVEKEIQALEEKKGAMDKEIEEKKEVASAAVDKEFKNKLEGIDKEIEEKKKILENKPAEGEEGKPKEEGEGSKPEGGAPSGEGSPAA